MTARNQLSDGPRQCLLLYGDVPLLGLGTLNELIASHHKERAVVSLLSFRTSDPTGYGRIIRDQHQDIRSIREHRDCSEQERTIDECNAGIYLFDREFLFEQLQRVDSRNQQSEFYLTDIVELATSQNLRALAHIVSDSCEVMGINDRQQLATLEQRWLQQRQRELMLQGITFHLPHTSFIGYDVLIDGDTEIEPNCCLLGKTHISHNCHIGAGSYLRDVELPPHTHLPPHTKLLGQQQLQYITCAGGSKRDPHKAGSKQSEIAVKKRQHRTQH
jgi:bifunctional UDP-N-acetylglucosamine pyrophosphorylase/glucosamine-1-phosphate N-acetyltransferase